jgi:hypothetical protein
MKLGFTNSYRRIACIHYFLFCSNLRRSKTYGYESAAFQAVDSLLW